MDRICVEMSNGLRVCARCGTSPIQRIHFRPRIGMYRVAISVVLCKSPRPGAYLRRGQLRGKHSRLFAERPVAGEAESSAHGANASQTVCCHAARVRISIPAGLWPKVGLLSCAD